MNKDLHRLQRFMFFSATILASLCALLIPGFSGQPDTQLKLSLMIPCLLAGAWSLPPILTRMMHEMIRAYESVTGRRVVD